VLLCGVWCCVEFVFFFFQAEDGIRCWSVTGVQTCALPICGVFGPWQQAPADRLARRPAGACCHGPNTPLPRAPCLFPAHPLSARSEERRVGEERGARW